MKIVHEGFLNLSVSVPALCNDVCHQKEMFEEILCGCFTDFFPFKTEGKALRSID